MNSQSVIELLTEKITHLRIAVIGDVMLDRYAYGEVRRISPEAPVPVTRVKRLTSVLGGAGNVAANLAGLGVQVYVAGMTGEDDHRRVLEKKLRELGVDYSGLIASPKRSTITKMRIIGARQQMLRLDFEEPGDLLPDEEQALLQWLRKHLDEGLDGIVLSDYAKGTCSDRSARWSSPRQGRPMYRSLSIPKGPIGPSIGAATSLRPMSRKCVKRQERLFPM